MLDAGCVFEFVVGCVPEETLIEDGWHRAALKHLFDHVETGRSAWRSKAIEAGASIAITGLSSIEYDFDRAIPKRWNIAGLKEVLTLPPEHRVWYGRDLQGVTPPEWLFQSFHDPPYSARCQSGLFVEFCDAIGLLPDFDVVVLDWVGSPDAEPERSAWSTYFDEGKEWWGIWCLTIWNPGRRTLSALAASATD